VRLRRQRPEDVEQNGIRELVAWMNGRTWVLGTRRRKDDYQGTNQTPGLADLWNVVPTTTRGAELLPALGFWWETKAPQGRRSPEQIAFGDACVMAGVPYGYGTLNDFIAWLIARGRLRPDQVAHYRRPDAAAVRLQEREISSPCTDSQT
jgi:hypothetical protein